MGALEKAARHRREGIESVLVACDAQPNDQLVPVWANYGGRIRFGSGTHLARLYGITATCTASDVDAVKAWMRRARDFLAETRTPDFSADRGD